MEIHHTSSGLAKIWIQDYKINLEPQALKQIENITTLPFIFKHIAIMPDAHLGKGACVGSVVATQGAVCPSLVGVDIGCGMIAVKTNKTAKDLPDSLINLRNEIQRTIPVGHHGHSTDKLFDINLDSTQLSVQISDSALSKMRCQLGTLGGGNHFIELCLDEEDNLWCMLHSGSRNIGKEVAEKHINGAKTLMKQMYITLADQDLAYYVQGTVEYQNYLNDVLWCQTFASLNRKTMLELLFQVLKVQWDNIEFTSKIVSCHHNYISLERHFGSNVVVTRKGAIQAEKGTIGIIPGSMGTKSFIVEGLGNRESFCSCSHGAGRKMSRTEARKSFTIEDLKKQTENVECRKDDGVLDEIPGAYKDIDVVMDNQKDLVRILHTLKQILCVKG
jgi:tRNA-splicing ligase RtcB